MRVLSGTFDQSDFIRFSKYFGRQCTANAVAGACKANVVNPSLWTPQTIDECLMTGNRLFELSYELLPSTFNHLYLRPDELYSTVSFPENEITFQVAVNEVFDGTSINSIATVSNDGPTNYCLHDAILCFFHNFHYGIFTCQVESIAVMKIENEYYVFDSHKRCKNGLRDGANGAAVLVCFADINELIIHLKALYRCSRCCSAPTAVCSSCQFSISPLIITNVTNITYHAQSNTNANSNVNNKRVSQLELARNAKKNKKTNKLLQKNKKVPAKKQIIVNNETQSSSPAELIDKIYDLRIRPTQVKYERTPEMKAKNVEQICKRYNTDVLVKETKSKQVKEKYQNDKSFRESHSKKMHEKYNTNESFKISHSKKMQEKMREKYNTNDSFKNSHNTNMKQKYQTDANYHNKLLSNAKNSYQSLQGSKRKLNYQNLYHASKKTKISLQERFNEQKREMPTVICTCCAQLFFKKSTVHELTLKIDKSLRISD
ncbi:Treslin, partial [Frankliniella fusca]